MKTVPLRYILYKLPIQVDTLALVQYCFSLGYDLRPQICIERNHQITTLPSIYDLDQQQWFYGLDQIVKYFETHTAISSLLDKALNFKKQNPDYRIGDK